MAINNDGVHIVRCVVTEERRKTKLFKRHSECPENHDQFSFMTEMRVTAEKVEQFYKISGESNKYKKESWGKLER